MSIWLFVHLKSTPTVYLALQTGEEVVIIFSALRGLFMSKYFTVPSWLAVVRCASSRWLQLIPWILARWAVIYWIGHEPFLKSHIRKSPSWAVASKLPETRLKPTCVAPAKSEKSHYFQSYSFVRFWHVKSRLLETTRQAFFQHCVLVFTTTVNEALLEQKIMLGQKSRAVDVFDPDGSLKITYHCSVFTYTYKQHWATS